jgi:hypothetical protein
LLAIKELPQGSFFFVRFCYLKGDYSTIYLSLLDYVNYFHEYRQNSKTPKPYWYAMDMYFYYRSFILIAPPFTGVGNLSAEAF